MLACFGGATCTERSGSRRELKHQKKQEKIQRQRTVHQDSHRFNELGFSFSGAGFLFPYFAGVASLLAEKAVIQPGCHLAGASAGALLAVNVNSGMSAEQGLESCLAFAATCRQNGIKGRLKQALKDNLEKYLPEDAHEKANAITHVAVTQAVPLRAKLVSHWSSRSDLIDCLVASCHLPKYSDDKLTSDFRGKGHMDGGVLNFIPGIPSIKTEDSKRKILTVGVCCFPKKYIGKLPVLNQKSALRNLAITPDSFSRCKWTFKQLLAYAFEPGPDEFLLELYEKGREDACRWGMHMALIHEDPAADRHLISAIPAYLQSSLSGTSSDSSSLNSVDAGPYQEALSVTLSLQHSDPTAAPTDDDNEASDSPPYEPHEALYQAAGSLPASTYSSGTHRRLQALHEQECC